MIVAYNCGCYNRTLVIYFSDQYEYFRDDIENYLDQYYDEWIFCDEKNIEDVCLEEYIIMRLSENYTLEMWYVEED